MRKTLIEIQALWIYLWNFSPTNYFIFAVYTFSGVFIQITFSANNSMLCCVEGLSGQVEVTKQTNQALRVVKLVGSFNFPRVVSHRLKQDHQVQFNFSLCDYTLQKVSPSDDLKN